MNGKTTNGIIGALSKNGKTQYTVVYGAKYPAPPKNAIDSFETTLVSVKKSAEEFVMFFKSITGAELPVVKDSGQVYDASKTYISIGDTGLLKQSGADKGIDYSALNGDGFFIRTVEKSLFINGANDRGVLYGCYDFLEFAAGLRFVAHDETYIPNLDVFPLRAIDRIQVPLFPYRCLQTGPTLNDARFNMRMRFNGIFQWDVKNDMTGGIIGTANNIVSSHHNTVGGFTPDAGYVQPKMPTNEAVGCGVDTRPLWMAHPEIFARAVNRYNTVHDYTVQRGNHELPLGNRNLPFEICFSSGIKDDGTADEETEVTAFKVARHRLRKALNDQRRDPNSRYIMFCQGDYFERWCECDKCKAGAVKYGEFGLIARFANLLADELAAYCKAHPESPKLYLVTYSYNFSRMAPEYKKDGKTLKEPTTKPRDNLCVFLANAGGLFRSYTDAKQQPFIKEAYDTWLKIAQNGDCKHFFMWDYCANYSNFVIYFNPLKALRDKLREVKPFGLAYYYAGDVEEKYLYQGNIDSYAMSKLFWDSALDITALRDEFMRLYYGPAADKVILYSDNFDARIDYLCENYNFDPGIESGLYPHPLAADTYLRNFPEGFLSSQILLLNQGVAAVEASDLSPERKVELILRVKRVRIQAKYMYAIGYWQYFPGKKEDARKYAEETSAEFDEIGMTTPQECRVGSGLLFKKIEEYGVV